MKSQSKNKANMVECVAALRVLDDASSRLLSSKRLADAVRSMDEALLLARTMYPAGSKELHLRSTSLLDTINTLSLQLINSGKTDEAHPYLSRALQVVGERKDEVAAVTFNNAACFYRKKKKLRTALLFLDKAFNIERSLPVSANPSGTLLNMAAVTSELGRHEEALSLGKRSLVYLQRELAEETARLRSWGEVTENATLLNKYSVLAVAFHNVGCECEHLHLDEQAIEHYSKGAEIAEFYLGRSSDVTKSLRRAKAKARKAIETRQSKTTERLRQKYSKGETLLDAFSSLPPATIQ
mmetsp:Transcript_5836/g.13818  ORF Transcript_5836/g.13818 Transcript_5836/m.13818 type:complete len:297 (+) Transcript_5836:128-1018(+)